METRSHSQDLEKRFIESIDFPFSIISEASEPEKGPGRPPHWEMVFWWTRKPLISARAIIAGCLLPGKTSPTSFLRSIGIIIKGRKPDGKPVFKTTPHRAGPELKFSGVKLLDPFAGFGSIPLEGLRLGLDVTAVELLPTAYVFLKAVLEYPTKYGEKLVEDVKKWGSWIIERLKEDQLIKKLYDEDVAVYIGSWEVKCPNCNMWTPLIGNWWLAKVKGKNGYERLAWMIPKKKEDEILIEVVDLNKKFGDKAVEGARVEGNKVVLKGEEYRVPESTIEARRELGTCLHCNQPIMQIDPEVGKHYAEVKKLPKEVKEKLRSYIKFALELYNKGIGYGINKDLPSWLDEIPARLRLLIKVKQKQGALEFEPCTEKDQDKLELARKEIEKMLQRGDPDIPKEGISLYSVRYLFPILYGMTEWYKLFNPHQLLTLVKLVKLIREAGKKIEEELKEESNQKAAFQHAEAVVTYLSIALAKFVDFSSLMTAWNPGYEIVQHTLAVRGIAMQWNWTDESPFIRVTGSFIKNLKTNTESLEYFALLRRDKLNNSHHNYEGSHLKAIDVIFDDATVLQKLDPTEKFDIIITDPPYYDDVPYAELSDFYYVWLKRALSDVEGGRLIPRFLPEVFFERIGNDWVEVPTQWEKYALSEVSLNPPRLGPTAKYEVGVKHFQNLLNSSFITMASRIEDDGLLVTYYAHTDPNAWKALLEAGWEAAGLMVTNAFPLTTESTLSVVKRGKLSMNTSIVVVWRKGCEGSIEASELYAEMVKEASERARKLLDLGIIGRDLIIGTLAAALAVATRYREIRVMGKIDVSTLVDKYVYPATYLGLAKAFAGKADLREGVKTPEGMFYLIVKSTVAGAKKKILESTDARIFSIGTSLDLNNALRDLRILKAEEKESGAKVAKAKTLRLLEPTFKESSRLTEFLEVRGVGISDQKIRCSVDALHLLEYWAVRYAREEFKRRLEEIKVKYPDYVEDALNMARIMARVLPSEDVEKELCIRIVEHLEPPATGLKKFVGQEEG